MIVLVVVLMIVLVVVPPTRLELFEQTHRTKKLKEVTSNTEYITPKVGMVTNAYKDAMVTKYGDDSDSHPPYYHELWLEVTGGIKKGRVLGFGSVSPIHKGFWYLL